LKPVSTCRFAAEITIGESGAEYFYILGDEVGRQAASVVNTQYLAVLVRNKYGVTDMP